MHPKWQSQSTWSSLPTGLGKQKLTIVTCSGGVIFPLMLQKLFPSVGFAWAVRILGFLLLFLLIIANLTIRSRLPRRPMASFKSVAPDLRVFKDIPFSLVTAGIFLMEWGLFVPLSYISSYGKWHYIPFLIGTELLNHGAVHHPSQFPDSDFIFEQLLPMDIRTPLDFKFLPF